jgi:hypothetical protein
MQNSVNEPEFSKIKPERFYITPETLSYNGKKIFCLDPFTFAELHSIIIPICPFEITCLKHNRIKDIYRCKKELDITGENLMHKIYCKETFENGNLSMLLFHPRAFLDKLFTFKFCHTTCLFFNTFFVLSTFSDTYLYTIV